MDRTSYKGYLKRPNVCESDIPRQTKFSKKKNVQATDSLEEQKPEMLLRGHNMSASSSTSTEIQFVPELSETSRSDTEEDDIIDDQEPTEEYDLHETDPESDTDNSESQSENKVADTDPLFPHSKITSSESALLIFAFSVRHKLTKSATEDLLELLELHVPKDSSLVKSKYHLRKNLNFDYSAASTHFYCPKCFTYGVKTNVSCEKCNFDLNQPILLKQGSYFITFDVNFLLDVCLKDKQVSENVRRNLILRKNRDPSSISSIFDGQCYKNLLLGEHDLSFLLNTDGVPVFKSSKVSIWPILGSLNELDYALKRKHVFTLGLWFGSEKPNINCFFTPLIQTARHMSNKKVKWVCGTETFESKVYFPLLVADSIARPLVQGIQQFNGHFGCSWCLNEGRSLRTENNTHKWIYLPDKQNHVQIRTHEQFVSHLREFEGLLSKNTNMKSHFGIKFASKLLLLPKFDIVDGFVFDYMHTALLGISRTFLNLWLDSVKHSSEYYIGNCVKAVDKILLQNLVPRNFDRTVRSVTTRKFWKANEWRTWTFISCAVLTDILPAKYVEHFKKFVRALMILSGETISLEDLNTAETLLFAFVNETKVLYGEYYCIYNVHLLLHACNCVRNWGPLYTYSAFQFEHFNGILLGYFHGTQQIPKQIADHVLELAQVHLRKKYIQNMTGKTLFSKLLKTSEISCKDGKCGIVFLGRSTLYNFSMEEKCRLESMGFGSHVHGLSFSSCTILSQVYNIFDKTTSKRCDCVVKSNNKYYLLNRVLHLTQPDFKLAIVTELDVVKSKSSPYTFFVKRFKKAGTLIQLSSIEKLKFIVCKSTSGSILYVVQIPNTVELE